MNSKQIVKLESIKIQIDRLKTEVHGIARECGVNINNQHSGDLETGSLRTLFRNLNATRTQLDIDIQNLVMEKNLQEKNNG